MRDDSGGGPVTATAPATAPGGTGAGFILRHGSPLRHAGLDLPRLFGLAPGPVNYVGTPISARHLNIGAL